MGIRRIFGSGDCGGTLGSCAREFAGVTGFVVEGEKRYWLFIAIDRFDGTISGQQLAEVIE